MTPDLDYPKIELHVHLEGSVSPAALIAAADRNGCTLPVRDEGELRQFMAFRDFGHFIEAWFATTTVLRTERDYRELVVDYARRAAARRVVYIEGIFSPTDKLPLGVDLDAVFSGFCDGAQAAFEETGVEVRLTPDITRGVDVEVAEKTARVAVGYRDRGIVALGLGGAEALYPPEPYARAFAIAREGGLGSVPHAGETAGPASVRGALDALGADRIRHGVRSVEDEALLAELADRGIVCDVCVLSNVCLSVVGSVEEHPLPKMLEAGVSCTVNTDDPTFFGCELEDEHRAALSLGASPRDLYGAGVAGALCEDAVRQRLRAIGQDHSWPEPAPAPASSQASPTL